MKKISRIMVVAIIACMLMSCSSTGKVEELPEFKAVRPVRPELIESVDPPQLRINVVRAVTYSIELEAYADALEEYQTMLVKVIVE